MSLFRHALINSDKKKFLKTIRYELILTPAYFGQNKGQAYPLSGKVFKNKAVFPVHLGEIKGFLIAIQHWEILMTDLGLSVPNKGTFSVICGGEEVNLVVTEWLDNRTDF